MTAHASALAPFSSGIRNLFRSGRKSGAASVDALNDAFTPPSRADTIRNDRTRTREQLLGDIGAFLAIHDLDATSDTLSCACSYLTGSDPEIARIIDQRIHARQPVSQDWLDTMVRQRAGMATLGRLMDRLQSSLTQFSATTRAARTATNEYNAALENHAVELGQIGSAGTVITELAALTRAMLERTRAVEEEMRRSEQESQALRRNLERARKAAEEDHLTGLPNRRAFEALYERECHAAREAGDALHVAFCDVDDFKRINDTHGHDAGDRVLALVARHLARISHDRCHVARHGGEEFVVLFRGTTLEAARDRLDRAREEIAERRFVNRANDTPFGMISFSAGIADVLACEDGRAALKAADEALYAAKRLGRNRVIVASGIENPPSAT